MPKPNYIATAPAARTPSRRELVLQRLRAIDEHVAAIRSMLAEPPTKARIPQPTAPQRRQATRPRGPARGARRNMRLAPGGDAPNLVAAFPTPCTSCAPYCGPYCECSCHATSKAVRS